MNPYVKLDIAEEILNAMIGHYSSIGYDTNNKALMQLMEDKKQLSQNDPATIEKLFNVYAPMVRTGNYTL